MYIARQLCLSFMLVLFAAPALPGIYAAESGAGVHTDALGRTLELGQQPQRVVSLVPSVTETIYAIGREHLLVGVTDFCNYPPAAQHINSVGAYNNPSIEAIAMLQPDLVILSADMATPALLQTLLELGIPAYSVYPRSIDTTVAMIRSLGALLGAVERAEAIAAQLEHSVQQLRRQSSAINIAARPKVMISVMVTPLVVAGGKTLPGAMLECAGGVNVAREDTRYPVWNVESVLEADPDIIVVSPHPGTLAPEDFFVRFKQLRAVARGNVVKIPADWLQRPGPRIINGLKALHEAIIRAGERH